jgi:hypothetical protein
MTYHPLLRPAKSSSATVVVEMGSPSGLPFLFCNAGLQTCQEGLFPMRTQKQIAASRENGRKSRGAATPDGQARIVQANLQSGIFAETQVLMWEHQEELQELKEEYYARHPPASPEARCLLDQIVMCEWHLRRFSWVEDSLWNQSFTASPQDSDPCAYALERGDQTFNRLQHRINSTRRAFHAALHELERLEARDRDAVVVSPDSVSPATHSPETRLQILGSLRRNDSGDPAASADLPCERRDRTHAGPNIDSPLTPVPHTGRAG